MVVAAVNSEFSSNNDVVMVDSSSLLSRVAASFDVEVRQGVSAPPLS